MQNVVLAALFVIDHELQRDPRPARPVREWRRAAVSSHVARVFLLHLTPPERARLARYDRRRTYDGRAVGSKGRIGAGAPVTRTRLPEDIWPLSICDYGDATVFTRGERYGSLMADGLEGVKTVAPR